MAKYDWEYLDRQDIIDNKLNDDGIGYWTIHFNVKKFVEYLNKDSKVKKDWWCTSNFGQDHVTLVAEHHDYGVRLFFEFDKGGFCDIERRFMATYELDHLGSWHYSKYDVDYSFDLIKDTLMNYDKKYMESRKSARKSMKERFDGYSKEDLLELGYDIDKIAKNFNPTVNKVEDSGDYFSLYLVDKKSKIGLWVDCSFDDEGYVTWEWNKYIFTTTNSKDMLIKYLQEEENTCWVCDCVIEDWCHENGKYRESKKSVRKSMKESSDKDFKNIIKYFDGLYKSLEKDMRNGVVSKNEYVKTTELMNSLYDTLVYCDDPDVNNRFGDSANEFDDFVYQIEEYDDYVFLKPFVKDFETFRDNLYALSGLYESKKSARKSMKEKIEDVYAELLKVMDKDEIDHHASDLYVKVTPESTKIVNNYVYSKNVTTFIDNIDHEKWYDIPFAYYNI